VTPAQAQDALRPIVEWLHTANKDLRAQSEAFADAAHEFRQAWSAAYMRTEGTQGDKKAQADLETSHLRLAMELADGFRTAALERVRSARQEISAIQSLMAAYKEEAAFARTGPQ
jgi:hypothetical protein